MILRVFQDTKFNEWAYQTLLKLTPEQKRLLNNVELKTISSPRNIKRFVSGAPFDRLHVIFSKVGISFAHLYYHSDNFDPSLIMKAYKQYSLKDGAIEIVKEMLAQNVFVLDNRQISISLSLMSMNCHSTVYRFNESLTKARRSTNEIRKVIKEKSVYAQFTDHTQAFKDVAKLLFVSTGIESYLSGKFNLSIIDLSILLILIEYPNNFHKISRIQKLIAERSTVKTVTVRCNYMFLKTEYVEKIPTHAKDISYRITSAGITIVGEIINHIVNQL